jgi:hypothetical protein
MLPIRRNAIITHEGPRAEVPIGYEPITKKPIFERPQIIIDCWLEVPDEYELFFRDDASDFYDFEMIGRLMCPKKLPEGLLGEVVQVKYWVGQEVSTTFDGQVFPRGTVAQPFGQVMFGDAIKVKGKSKPIFQYNDPLSTCPTLKSLLNEESQQLPKLL